MPSVRTGRDQEYFKTNGKPPKLTTFGEQNTSLKRRNITTDEFLDCQFELIRSNEATTSLSIAYISYTEHYMAGLLNKAGIPFLYEPFWMKMTDARGREHKFLPDFVTGLKIKGKPVIIETHGVQKEENVHPVITASRDAHLTIKKFLYMYSAFSDQYHIVLSVDEKLMKALELWKSMYTDVKLADEIICVPSRIHGKKRDWAFNKKLQRLKQKADRIPNSAEKMADTHMQMLRKKEDGA